MRSGTALAITLLALTLAIGGCGRDASVPRPASAAQTDQAAIAAATGRERAYQDALAKGRLDFLDCGPGAPDAVRLVEMQADDALGYSLAMTADNRGAVAIWQGIQKIGPGKYQAYGARGMRMDVNGWRQVRQLLAESNDHAIDDGFSPPRSFVVACLDGQRDVRHAAEAQATFERLAVRMRRLAGNYYSPPARTQD